MKSNAIILTPAIVQVMRKVPAQKVEDVLRAAFPEAFAESESPKTGLARLRQLPLKDADVDVMGFIREMRDAGSC